jgi:HlyD family secretion protein
LTELEKSIPPLEQELASKEELFKEGLLGLNNLHETRQLLSQRKIAIEVTKGNLATLEANLSKSYREQELREKERNLLEQLQQNEILKLEKKFNTVITPSAGRVLDILVKSGNHVQAGTPLVRMEYSTDEKTSHLFLAFVPLKYGKSIDVGSQVTLELATIKAEEYGSILGRVKEVSLYPISQAAIQNTIQNEGLVKYLTLSDKYLMEVIIEPELDPATPTGYKWTSGTGPDTTISSGTTFFVKGIIARTSPLYYFFSLSEVRRFEGDIKNLIWKE